MPTLTTSYFLASAAAGDSTALVTPSFTPVNGEVIVVKTATWDTATPSGTPSGGSQTFTRRATAQPGGFNCYCTIFTAIVSGSPGAMTVTLSAPSATCFHTMTVERWANATLAATPATNATVNGSGTALTTLTTTAANSIITWVSVDDASKDPASRTYVSGTTEDGLGDGHAGVNSVQYYAYQKVISPISQTIGMWAPVGQTWVMAGIEVLDVPGPGVSEWLFKA